MTPPLAIALAYGIVWIGVLLYLIRLRRRVTAAERETRTSATAPKAGVPLGVR